MELQPEGAGRRLQVLDSGSAIGIGRVEEHADAVAVGTSSRSNSSRFGRELHVQCGYAREIAARPVEAGDKSDLDRVAAGGEDDRNRRGRCLGRERRRSAPVATITAT